MTDVRIEITAHCEKQSNTNYKYKKDSLHNA